jgi:hypothetical protein
LARLDGRVWQQIRMAWNLRILSPTDVSADRAVTVWVFGEQDGVYFSSQRPEPLSTSCRGADSASRRGSPKARTAQRGCGIDQVFDLVLRSAAGSDQSAGRANHIFRHELNRMNFAYN